VSGYLLDTNIPSEVIRLRADNRVDAWIRSQDDESLYLSAVTIGELRKGLCTHPEGKRKTQIQEWLSVDLIPMFAGRILPVTQAIAERWGDLSGRRQQMGRPLGMADGLIAATALEHGLILVTRNVKDFEGIDLAILNPWES
jgi:predicted nucleic acid-binding protein